MVTILQKLNNLLSLHTLDNQVGFDEYQELVAIKSTFAHPIIADLRFECSLLVNCYFSTRQLFLKPIHQRFVCISNPDIKPSCSGKTTSDTTFAIEYARKISNFFWDEMAKIVFLYFQVAKCCRASFRAILPSPLARSPLSNQKFLSAETDVFDIRRFVPKISIFHVPLASTRIRTIESSCAYQLFAALFTGFHVHNNNKTLLDVKI